LGQSNNIPPAKAEPRFLEGLFTLPEPEQGALHQLEKKLSENLHEYLSESKVAGEIPLSELVKKYTQYSISEDPCFVAEQVDFLMKDVIPYCVHTGSPKFIGHMTSAIPYFLQSLSKGMVALHQNTVKIETSRSFTFLERQTLAQLHHLIYNEEESFYKKHMHRRTSTLGIQCSGGTVANIMALWVARNRFISSILGEENDLGLIEALQRSGKRNLAIFVSSRGHYSLSKAADLLGIGKANLISVAVDNNHRLDISDLEESVKKAISKGLHPLAVVGIAGTTETGHVDPLYEIGQWCSKRNIWFHVDGAWGGAVVMSRKWKHLVEGIELADSVVLDGHKQLYLPMGVGMLLLKNPDSADQIQHHTKYIIRESSYDLGAKHLEGSRSGHSFLTHSALNIFGRKGYELLIDRNQEMCLNFAQMIESHDSFELITAPELNLLTYRFHPLEWKAPGKNKLEALNELNVSLQKQQREQGQSFVSRTQFSHPEPTGPMTTVLRSVIANPLTRKHHLEDILAEQLRLGMKLLQELGWEKA
jgi:aspartate 1-decarboxylase